ncbi:hypothetical protein CDD80_4330 [Ophiocordyceps camponoti-rufipedis]|uniref:Uncharacterized protein n=1 Tax=Ophiocordyceps camponoti-rufipedis TaxID=2004952 RepID=A0A2C5ZLY0_9HYPO|nr:hypothetical protein CDD80_4330 [Ophiocordyceps camponoti-rufipedis]
MRAEAPERANRLHEMPNMSRENAQRARSHARHERAIEDSPYRYYDQPYWADDQYADISNMPREKRPPQAEEQARGHNQDPSAHPLYPSHGPYPLYHGFYPPPPNYGPINNYYNHISPSYKFHSVTNKKDQQLAPDLVSNGIPTTTGYVDNSSGKDATDNRGANGGTYVGVNSAAFVDKGATSIGTDSRGYNGHYSDSRGQNSKDYSSTDSRGQQSTVESGGSRGKVGADHSTITKGEKDKLDEEDLGDFVYGVPLNNDPDTDMASRGLDEEKGSAGAEMSMDEGVEEVGGEGSGNDEEGGPDARETWKLLEGDDMELDGFPAEEQDLQEYE